MDCYLCGLSKINANKMFDQGIAYQYDQTRMK